MDSINGQLLPHHAGLSGNHRLAKDDTISPGDGGEKPPSGDAPAPDPPSPPPQPPADGFSPFGPGYSIPAYGAATVQATMVGLSEYGRLFSSSPTPPAPQQAGSAAATAVSSVGTWMSGLATGLLYLKGGHELYYGIKGKDEAKIVEGSLDLLIGSATLTSAIPGLAHFGALSTVIFIGVKVLYDAMKTRK
jgi:hypothetical protein